MKKTILAVVIAVASGSAFADVSVYNNNGLDVAVGGAAEVQAIQGFELFDKKTDGDIRLDDGNLHALTTVDINGDLKAFGYFDFDFEDGNVSNSDLYVGLKNDMHSVKIGKTATVWDDTGVNKSIELGRTSNDDDDGVFGAASSGQNVIRYDLTLDNGLYAAIGGDLKVDQDNKGDSQHIDGKVGFKRDNYDVRAFAQKSSDLSPKYLKKDAKVHKFDGSAYAVEGQYKADKFGLAIGYYNISGKEVDTARKGGFNLVSLAGNYTGIETLDIAMGINYLTGFDSFKNTDVVNPYINVTKKLHPNVKVYTEVGYVDVTNMNKKNDDSFGYLAGMEVSF